MPDPRNPRGIGPVKPKTGIITHRGLGPVKSRQVIRARTISKADRLISHKVKSDQNYIIRRDVAVKEVAYISKKIAGGGYENTSHLDYLGRTYKVKMNKKVYATDSPHDAIDNNTFVNTDVVFTFANVNIPENMLVSYMVGNFRTGTGPENYVFPADGYVSETMRKSHIVESALENFYLVNKIYILKHDYSNIRSTTRVESYGVIQLCKAVISHLGIPLTIEDMVGSARIRVYMSGYDVIVDIFNITSVSSGDFYAKVPGIKNITSPPRSIIRNPNLLTPLGNISQRFLIRFNLDWIVKKYFGRL